MNSEYADFEYPIRLSTERLEAIEALEPHKDQIIAVTHYRDLLALPKDALEILVAYEEFNAKVAEKKDDLGIIARTGGHHRDMLDIYRHALAGDARPEGCYALMNEKDGRLYVCLANIFNEIDRTESGGDGGHRLRLKPVPDEEDEDDEKPSSFFSANQ